MDEIYLACPGSGPTDRSIAADVFLREGPDEDEEEEDGEEGYSE